MRFKYFLASPSNAKTRFVAAVIAILVTYMASGEAFPDDVDRVLGVAHLQTSDERNLRTSTIMTSDDEERLPLESVAGTVKDFFRIKKETNPFASRTVDLSALKKIVEDHASLPPEMAKANVLATLHHDVDLAKEVEPRVLATFRKLGGDARLAGFLRLYERDPVWGRLCSSLSARLFNLWLDEGVTTRKAFARLRLNRIKVQDVFTQPLLVTWWRYAEKISVHKSTGSKQQKRDTMFSEMIDTLSHYYGFLSTIETLSTTSKVDGNFLPTELYRVQLEKWEALNLEPSALAKVLKLTKNNWYHDVRRLFVWVDFVARTNKGKLRDFSTETFGEENTKAILTLNRHGVGDQAQLDGIAGMKEIFANDAHL